MIYLTPTPPPPQKKSPDFCFPRTWFFSKNFRNQIYKSDKYVKKNLSEWVFPGQPPDQATGEWVFPGQPPDQATGEWVFPGQPPDQATGEWVNNL